MDRQIMGTFRNEKDTILEVKRLIDEEGYSPEEFVIIMDKDNHDTQQFNQLKEVDVNEIEIEEENVWEKIKEALSFGTYEIQNGQPILEEYGVPSDRAEELDALNHGEIVLLADSDAPKNNGLSDLNEDVIRNDNQGNERRTTMNKDKEKNNHPVDEVNTEEEEAVKDKESNPSEVDTSETNNEEMNQSIDPSQAENVRAEDDDKNDDSGQGTDSKEEPDLSGEEETVDAEESEHGYGNTVADGVVKPETKNPLKTEGKPEKDSSEEK